MKLKKLHRSTTTSFVSGMGRAIDISGTSHFPDYFSYFFGQYYPSNNRNVDDLNWLIIGSVLDESCEELASKEHIEGPEESQLILPL